AINSEIHLDDWESGHLLGRLAREAHRRLLLRSGVPPAVFDQMKSIYDEISLLTDAIEADSHIPLRDEMEIEFESGSLRVLHTPGHTPGSCS
ncbi:MBL fold metallo-hydrolase, partial [Acinetobacter baumannii]